MKSAQNPSQPNAQNQYPNMGPAGRMISGMPAPFTGENGMFTQAYNNVSAPNSPFMRIMQALGGTKVGQMLGGMTGQRRPPPTTPPTV